MPSVDAAAVDRLARRVDELERRMSALTGPGVPFPLDGSLPLNGPLHHTGPLLSVFNAPLVAQQAAPADVPTFGVADVAAVNTLGAAVNTLITALRAYGFLR